MPETTQSTRETRIAERKRKQEAIEAAKAAVPSARKPRRDEIALCSDHLTCPICREIFENAVETSCGHLYCENCVAIQIANGNKKCAVCRAGIRSADLRPSVPIRRIVSDMDTTCTNAECKWKGTRGNLQDHELMCGYTEVQCEYGHDKCGSMRRMDLKKHHVSECLFFICKCTLGCGQSFPRRDLSKHKKVCPNARAKCERCAQPVRRRDIPHHAEHVCPKSKISCFAGCKGKMLREQLGGHILSNLGPHLCALATSARIAEQENKKLAARLAEQEKAMAAMAQTVAELQASAGAPAEDEDEEDEEGDGEEDEAADEDGDDAADDDDEDEDVDADGSGAGATSSADGSSSADSSGDEEDDEEADSDAEEAESEEAGGEEAEEDGSEDANSSDADSDRESGSGDDDDDDEGTSQDESEDSGGQYLLRLAGSDADGEDGEEAE